MLFMGKYVGLPLLGFKVASSYFLTDVDDTFR